jgi:hypothetical protein
MTAMSRLLCFYCGEWQPGEAAAPPEHTVPACMVTWKRRVMRRRKQEIGSLDGEGTWSVPDTNENLIDE